jgi:hypothetical protein
MPMTEEDIDNFDTSENYYQPLQGEVRNLFGTSQDDVYFNPYSYDVNAFNNHIDSYNRQKSLASFFTPTNQKNHASSTLNNNFMSTRKNALDNGFTNAKRFKELHQTIFTPTKSFRHHPIHTNMTFGSPFSLQPQVLNITKDFSIDNEVIRSKRNLIAKGPPLLPDEPTVIRSVSGELQ